MWRKLVWIASVRPTKNESGALFIVQKKSNSGTINKNIASIYYYPPWVGYMAMFASNASYGTYLRSCPNQALTWHAMMAFKAAGLHYLDMGGSGDYKLNISGDDWQPRPIIIYCSYWFERILIIGAKEIMAKDLT